MSDYVCIVLLRSKALSFFETQLLFRTKPFPLLKPNFYSELKSETLCQQEVKELIGESSEPRAGHSTASWNQVSPDRMASCAITDKRQTPGNILADSEQAVNNNSPLQFTQPNQQSLG